MRERHNTTIAVFGGRPGQGIEFKSNVHVTLSILIDENTTSGMAGNQVLEWTDLDSEIKTAGLKKVRVTLMTSVNSAQRKILSGSPCAAGFVSTRRVLATRY